MLVVVCLVHTSLLTCCCQITGIMLTGALKLFQWKLTMSYYHRCLYLKFYPSIVLSLKAILALRLLEMPYLWHWFNTMLWKHGPVILLTPILVLGHEGSESLNHSWYRTSNDYRYSITFHSNVSQMCILHWSLCMRSRCLTLLTLKHGWHLLNKPEQIFDLGQQYTQNKCH